MKQKILTVLIMLLLCCSMNTYLSSMEAQKVISENHVDTHILEMIQHINETIVFDYMQSLLSFGARYTGSENCSQAADWIFDTFYGMGLDTMVHQWEYGGFSSQNIVATLPGTDSHTDAQIILSAHYDCTPGSLGADDDGSGVVAVLAAASVMKDYSFNHTIKFIAFSGEEVGTYGSFCYARDAYRNGDDIYAVLNLDMIGYANSKDGGNLLRFHCPSRSWWIGEDAQQYADVYAEYTNISVETRPNYIGADHQAFIDYGYDGVWIAHRDGYPWANTPGDNPDHLNWTYQTKATKAMIAITASFARKPIPIQVSFTKPQEGMSYFFNRSLFPLDFGSEWYKGYRGMTIVFGRPLVSIDISSNDALDRVIYCIDGNFMVSLSKPPYDWQLQGKHFPFIGRHLLQVYAYTESGAVAFDEIELWIFTLSCQYGKW